ncbi:MAG: TonB-dependent receptor plug domain-containing protein [Deltaproteobacteria bacterium]|nr:TonB-dependent receptor plug domain-containing protein [Deltaproteobacteria bacterium]
MKNFLFILILTFCSKSFAQTVQGRASEAPTSFTSDLDLSQSGTNSNAAEILNQSTSLFLKDSGVKTFSMRGSPAREVSVSLEGVPLNSEAQGEFDFNNFSLFGLESARIIRGGYTPNSSSPSGEIQFQLPQENKFKTSLGIGSYETYFIGQQIPHASFAYEQSENNYSFKQNGISQKREHNAHKKVAARAWKQSENFQVWGQVLYSDQEMPGSLSWVTPQASMKSFAPMLAAQYQIKTLTTSAWSRFQNQSDQQPDSFRQTTNRWLSCGVKIQNRHGVSKNLSFEETFIWNLDKLWTTQRENSIETSTPIPYRQSISGILSATLSPNSSHLIHPRVRVDYLSDLDEEHLAINPGIGGRHSLLKNFGLLWNAAYLSKAPSFTDMYMEALPYAISNPNLKRQRSLQGDFGYEFSQTRTLKLKQAFFASRNLNYLRSSQVNNIWQVKNLGTSVILGLENEARFQPAEFFVMSLNYTLQRVSLDDHQASYQPTHLWHSNFEFFPNEPVGFDFPLYARSSVQIDPNSSNEISSQWDFGFHSRAQIRKWFFDLRIFNLLGWQRMEVDGYPLASEIHGKISATYRF